MNLIIDIGNTQVKAAVFESNRVLEHCAFDEDSFLKNIESILRKYQIEACILSSVKEMSEDYGKVLQEIPYYLELKAITDVPFTNLYDTPNTLGLDRIALVAAASVEYPSKNVLVIDAGTCITFDFINSNNEYLGGAISPGIGIRYKSLNYYTSKLPELEKIDAYELVGKSTSSSIHSGVINGVVNEINGVISQYEEKFHDLTIVLTGGDTNFLSKQLKNSIFANQNFLLYGLNKILTFNNQE
ncbi:MAG: type III pantothenate kinase [Flavobacteriaceae bacterium]